MGFSQPVGLAVSRSTGKQNDLGSILLQLFPLSSKVVGCGQFCDFVSHKLWS